MKNKWQEQMKKAKKKGLSPLELLQMKELARKYGDIAEKQATEKAFLYMLAIPLNVLVADNWSKSAKARAPKFIQDVISLYESVQAGAVTDQELADLLKEYSGVSVEAEWMKKDGDHDEAVTLHG